MANWYWSCAGLGSISPTQVLMFWAVTGAVPTVTPEQLVMFWRSESWCCPLLVSPRVKAPAVAVAVRVGVGGPVGVRVGTPVGGLVAVPVGRLVAVGVRVGLGELVGTPVTARTARKMAYWLLWV